MSISSYFRKLASPLIVAAALLLPGMAHAQATEKTIEEQGQVWLGIMTQTRVSKPLSIWADIHFVPGGFFLPRTGLTWHLNENMAVTGGYAFGLLPLGPDDKLERLEHRPWAQLFYNAPFAKNWSISQRVRYDMRFKQNVAAGETVDGFTLTNRVRFAINIRRSFKELTFFENYTPFATVGDEVLVNFGESIVYNTFDQNRIIGGIGVTQDKTKTSLQVSYMNRLVQQASGDQYQMNHTFVVWVSQNFDCTPGE